MPTNFVDQFFFINPSNPPAVGSNLTFYHLELTDQNDDGDVDRFSGDSVNGIDVTRSWPGDTVTINVPGQGNITYTGITFYLADGSRVFTPTDGQVLQNGTFQGSTYVNTQGPLDVDDLGPVCFTPETKILTPDGERWITDLKVGDLVATRDNGAQPIVWIGRTRVQGHGDLAPIRFKAGVLGAKRPLIVSPQHRMVIDDWRAAYFFGHSEVLIAAQCLVNGTTVKQVKRNSIDYIHLLFAAHEVIFANGVASESYYPGHALTRSDRETEAEITALFPELTPQDAAQSKTALPVIRPREARMLAV